MAFRSDIFQMRCFDFFFLILFYSLPQGNDWKPNLAQFNSNHFKKVKPLKTKQGLSFRTKCFGFHFPFGTKNTNFFFSIFLLTHKQFYYIFFVPPGCFPRLLCAPWLGDRRAPVLFLVGRGSRDGCFPMETGVVLQRRVGVALPAASTDSAGAPCRRGRPPWVGFGIWVCPGSPGAM